MKAAVLKKLDNPLEIMELGLGELQPGQVLVRMLVSGICGAQLQEISGIKGNGRFLPHLMGHEGVGIVEKIGAGVRKVKEGDKVVLHWRLGSGIDSNFPNYLAGTDVITSGKVNTLAEKVIVSENRVTSVDMKLDNKFAALLGCSLSTAFSLIEKDCNLLFGENVLVLGGGGLGLSIVLAANRRGAAKVDVMEKSILKEDLCLRNGASSFIISNEIPVSKYDLIIDTTGYIPLINRSLGWLEPSGRLCLISQSATPDAFEISNFNGMFAGKGFEKGQKCVNQKIKIFAKKSYRIK